MAVIETIRRVSLQNPCPCCGRSDWCGFTGKLALCQRVPSDRQAKNGAWIHELDGQRRPVHLPEGRPYQRVAPVGARHKWYSALARACGLDPEHYEDLRRRCLTDEAIHRNGYATLPAPKERGHLIEALLQEIRSDPGHIPGFYKDEDGRWNLAGPAGLLCPVRDENFLIQAFQIRRPDERVQRDSGPRYVWLSSAGDQRLPSGHVVHRLEGTSSGAPLHHQRLPGRPLWVTEGTLKADLLHQAFKVSTVGLPGVASWRQLLTDPMLARTPMVVVAFDYDRDPEVRRHVVQCKHDLVAALKGKGLCVRSAGWDGPKAKGIDDAIQAGLRVVLEPVPILAPTRVDDR